MGKTKRRGEKKQDPPNRNHNHNKTTPLSRRFLAVFSSFLVGFAAFLTFFTLKKKSQNVGSIPWTVFCLWAEGPQG
jgi:uncharacterized membrane protein YdcZ (DUF606 family)